MEKTRPWDLVSLLKKIAIGSKWVYKIKTDANGSLERHKAYLATKGFTKEYDGDYDKTFAPINKLTTIQSLIVVVSVQK